VRVLIIPDKFKGTLTAREAGEAMAEGWRSVRAQDEVEVLPMSDGGDGFGPIIGGMMGLTEQAVETVDSAGRPHTASFWTDGRTAVIEAAQVNGLALLPAGKFHPFELDTFGLGKFFSCAHAAKAIVGIGGSATNDAGFGLARALGWKFFANDFKIRRWTDLDQLQRIESGPALPMEIIVAVDVQNPLLGPNGASRIYGPQKGLRQEDMAKAEACLGKLAEVARENLGFDAAIEPGAGAAGGLGFGLRAFLNGKFVPGSEIFAQASRLDERLQSADLVISGEGAIDAQSLMGKGVGELFARCRKAGVARIGLAGSLGKGIETALASDPDLRLHAIVPTLTNLEQAKAEPAKWVRALAAEAAKSRSAR
jgi:glycerate kinase